MKAVLQNRAIAFFTSLVPILLTAISPVLPMWYFHLNAPFYGQRWLEVIIHPLTGVRGDIEEVNIVNHYVGLDKIGNEYIPELPYLPYVYVLLLALMIVQGYSLLRRKSRIALVTTVLAAVTFASTLGYVYFWLYRYTHTIQPGAPVKIEPFDPPFLGEYKIANFVIRSTIGPSLILHVAAIIIGAVGLIRSRKWSGQ